MSEQQPLTRDEREAYRLEYTGNARSYSPATQIAIIRLLDDLDRAERQLEEAQKPVLSSRYYLDIVADLAGADSRAEDAIRDRAASEQAAMEAHAKLGAAERERDEARRDQEIAHGFETAATERQLDAERERDEANTRARKAADDLTTYLLQLRIQREQISSLVSERDEAERQRNQAITRMQKAEIRAENAKADLASVCQDANVKTPWMEAEAVLSPSLKTILNDNLVSLAQQRDQANARAEAAERRLAEVEAEEAGMRRCIDEELMPRYRDFWDAHFPERFSDSIAYQEAIKATSGTAGRDLLARYRVMQEALGRPLGDYALEKLAVLEHQQWEQWSQSVAGEVSEERLRRWEGYWRPYEELTPEVQEHDRVWARKVLRVINDLLDNRARAALNPPAKEGSDA